MAVTNDGRSILMSAAADAVTGRKCLSSLVIQGTGLTAGEEFVVSEADGNVIARGYITATHEYLDLLPSSPLWVDGITWTTKPATGTCRLHATMV